MRNVHAAENLAQNSAPAAPRSDPRASVFFRVIVNTGVSIRNERQGLSPRVQISSEAIMIRLGPATSMKRRNASLVARYSALISVAALIGCAPGPQEPAMQPEPAPQPVEGAPPPAAPAPAEAAPPAAAEPAAPPVDGQQVFRHDTFGDEQFWTDTAKMHEVIAKSVSPKTALAVGLKVD